MIKPAYGQPINKKVYDTTIGFFDNLLHLLHPFMPFITEEIYQALPGSAETIMTQEWPDAGKMTAWPQECADFEVLMDYIKAVRTIRNDMNVHPAKKTSMTIETATRQPSRKAALTWHALPLQRMLP